MYLFTAHANNLDFTEGFPGSHFTIYGGRLKPLTQALFMEVVVHGRNTFFCLWHDPSDWPGTNMAVHYWEQILTQ